MTAPQASAILKALEGAWATIRKAHPEIPEVVMILASGAQPRGKQLNGYHAPMRWVPAGAKDALSEVLIAGERLADGAEAVLQTMLHEAAHSLAFARNIKDCCREGNVYHNGEFAKHAAELGLTPPAKADRKHGYSFCEMPGATEKKYGRTLAAMRKALVAVRRREGYAPKPPRSSRNGVVLVCPGCGRKLRQRGETDRATLCATAHGEICGVMAAEEGTEDDE